MNYVEMFHSFGAEVDTFTKVQRCIEHAELPDKPKKPQMRGSVCSGHDYESLMEVYREEKKAWKQAAKDTHEALKTMMIVAAGCPSKLADAMFAKAYRKGNGYFEVFELLCEEVDFYEHIQSKLNDTSN